MADEYINVRIKLADVGRFIAQTGEAGAAVKGFGREVAYTAEKTEFSRVETFLWRQGLYTLRRELFYGTVALAGLGAGALKVGYDFNEASQKATAAFTGLLGSARLARQEVSALVGLTHVTGFQLPQLADAATKMLDFGFSVKETNAQLKAFGLFAQKRNLGTGGIEELTNLFARIKDQGGLSGRVILSLERAGVPVKNILQKQLGLTDAQWQQVRKGKLVIPTEFAIPALTRGIAATPGALGLGGQIGRIRSWISELTGLLTRPLFGWADKLAPRIDAALSRATKGFKAGGLKGLFLGLDPSGRLLSGWKVAAGLFTTLGAVLRQVWAIVKVGLPLLGALTGALVFLSHHGTLLKTVLVGLVIWYGYSRTALIAWRIVARLSRGDMLLLTGATEGMTGAQKGFVLWTNRSTIAQAISSRFGLRLAKTMQLLRAMGWLAAASFTAMWDALLGPVGVALAVGAVFVVLYVKWKAFHDLVNRTFSWMKSNWPLLVGILGGPIGLAVEQIIVHFQTLVGWFDRIRAALAAPFKFVLSFEAHGPKGIVGAFLKGVAFLPTRIESGVLHRVTGHRLPGFATGGVMPFSGPAIVGERGPEIVTLPARAKVQPASVRPLDLSQAPIIVNVHAEPAPVIIDGQKVAEVTFKWALAGAARR